MVNVSIARRYARALLDVASEAGVVDKVLAQLETLSDALNESEELRDLATNPAYSRDQRRAVMEGLLKARGGIEPVLSNALALLNDRNRLGSLPDIARLYRDRADALAGRVRGKLTSAVPLSTELVAKLEQTFERLTQRNVLLDTKVDPKVLGGVRAQVGSLVYDGSLRTHLDEMRRALKQRA
jgi:F-type H+-transporting ATPase subunit delta